MAERRIVDRQVAQNISLDRLSPGGQLLIWSLRTWTLAAQTGECACAALNQAYTRAGCIDAAALLDEFMSLIALAACRPVDIRCPKQERLSADEYQLMDLLVCLQTDREVECLPMIRTLLAGSVSISFCRVAVIYARALTAAKLPLSLPPILRVVK